MTGDRIGGIDGYTDPDQLTIDDALPHPQSPAPSEEPTDGPQ